MKLFSRETLENHKIVVTATVLGGVVAFLAALPTAIGTVTSAGSSVVKLTEDPDPVELAVDDFVSSIYDAVNWANRPTIQVGSVNYFKDHFGRLNPYVPHPFVPNRAVAGATVTVDEVARRLPEFEGQSVVVEGRLTNVPVQVSKYPNATSWAFFLGDTMNPDNLVVCRAPLPNLAEGEELPFVAGDTMVAEGVLLADGGVQASRPAEIRRAIYMACSSVGRRPVPEDGEIYSGVKQGD